MGGRDGVTARCSTVQTSVQTAKNILSNDHIGKSNDMVSFYLDVHLDVHLDVQSTPYLKNEKLL